MTREDCLRFEERRAALAGIVQALLVTRHMLFVGFDLQDDNFHRIADAIRKVMTRPGNDGKRARLGTVVSVTENRLLQEVWSEDLHWPCMVEGMSQAEGARIMKILPGRSAVALGAICILSESRIQGPSRREALADALREFVKLRSPGGAELG